MKSESPATYPEHIYNSTRRQIAVTLLEKEFLKLFPHLHSTDRQQITHNMAGWFDGEGYELAPAHDFWNATEGILDGFKLKHITRFLTAQNITWRQEDIAVDGLMLTAHLPGLQADAGNPPYTAQQLRQLFANPAIRQHQLDDDERHLLPARDHYPIIALRKGDKLQLLDGNRRLRQAILHDREQLNAYVGSFENEPYQPLDYWISTPSIRTLLQTLNEVPSKEQPQFAEAVRAVLHRWFAVSSVARINFQRATATKFNQYHFLEELDDDKNVAANLAEMA